MEERKSPKDGKFYRRVGDDAWEPVVRQSPKDGKMYQKIGDDQWAPLEAPMPKGASTGDKAHAALEGYAKSSSMGTLPYLKAGVEKYVTDPLAEAVYGVPAGDKSYGDRVAAAKEQSSEVTEKAPSYAMAGEIAGFVAPGMAASKLVGKGIQAAAGSSKLAASVANSGKASRLYSAAKKAKQLGNLERAARLTSAARGDLALQGVRLGAEGALVGAAYTPESGFSDLGARAENAAVGLGVGAVMPAALRGAGNVIKGTVKAPLWAGRKMLSSLGGVSEDVMDRYLKNPDRINSAKTFDELYEKVSGIVNRMGDDLDNAKIDYDAAKAHLDEVADGIKNSRVEGKEKALEQVTQAREILDEAFKGQKQSLAQRASPSNVEPLVNDALSGLKKTVSQGSKEAFETLGDDAVSVSETHKGLVNQLKDLSARGSDSAKQAVTKLKQYSDLIFSKGATDGAGGFKLPAKEIKRLIQDIDNDVSSWNLSGGSFDDAYNLSLKQLRKSLDQELKASSPAYQQKMLQVADDAKLLGQASERFGKPDRALSRLGNLTRSAAKYDVETLKALGKKQGGELPQAVDDMAQAQRTLKSPTRLDAVKQSLPESAALREAEMKAAAAKRLAKPKLTKIAIEKSAANFKAQSAKAKFQQRKEVFAKFKSFGEQGAEGKLKQVAAGRKHAAKVLRELSEYSDEDLVEAVKAAKDAAFFNKSMFHGSRNVNLWTVMGALGQSVVGRGGVGAASGGVFGGPVGMAVGAVTGAMLDVYGPKVTKQILDGLIKIKGPFTVGALSRLSIPPAAKAELIRTFRASVLTGRAASDAGKMVADKDTPKKGQEKWADDGLKKLLDHAKDSEQKKALEKARNVMLQNPKLKQLLIYASDLKPGSPALDKVLEQIKKEQGRDLATEAE